MTRPAAATWGNAPTGVRVEYPKGRRVLRLTGSDDDAGAVEVPLDEFLADLGIDIDQLAPPPRYLLFAAVGNGPDVSPRHVVATYVDEPDARDAFWALRMGFFHPQDWAEVAAVQPSGGLRRLCWFGTPWGPGGLDRTGPELDGTTELVGGPARRTGFARWRPRRRAAMMALPITAE